MFEQVNAQPGWYVCRPIREGGIETEPTGFNYEPVLAWSIDPDRKPKPDHAPEHIKAVCLSGVYPWGVLYHKPDGLYYLQSLSDLAEPPTTSEIEALRYANERRLSGAPEVAPRAQVSPLRI